MSDYTTQLRFICESYANRSTSAPSSDVDEVIELARPKIFDFDYPIFDPNYKKDLESKILQHYYTQEIGLETVGLWKLKLRTKMREIMPFYNKLYESEKLQFDPFINTDYKDEHSQTGSDTRDTTVNASGSSRTDTDNVTDDTLDISVNKNYNEDTTDNISGTGSDLSEDTTTRDGTDKTEFTPQADKKTLVKSSDTPLGSVNGVTGDTSNYLSGVTETVENYGGTSANKDTSLVTHDTTDVVSHTGSSENSSSEAGHKEGTDATATHQTDHNVFDGQVVGSTSSETVTADAGSNASDYAGRIFGKQGSETYSEMLLKFRETFLNIDMQVIDELNDLFMQIW